MPICQALSSTCAARIQLPTPRYSYSRRDLEAESDSEKTAAGLAAIPLTVVVEAISVLEVAVRLRADWLPVAPTTRATCGAMVDGLPVAPAGLVTHLEQAFGGTTGVASWAVVAMCVSDHIRGG